MQNESVRSIEEFKKRLDMEHFHRFVTVFVTEDREMGKWCISRVCLRDKECNLTVAACVTLSRDKIAGVTSVLLVYFATPPEATTILLRRVERERLIKHSVASFCFDFDDSYSLTTIPPGH